jgi:heme-degrading monooxygenase HmoA
MHFLDRPPPRDRDRSDVPAAAIGAAALGAAALGATALGALAIGAFAIGRLAIGKARVRSLEIDDLTVNRLTLASDPADAPDAPAIARIWRGRTRRDMADAYQEYYYEVGIKPLIEKALGVQALRQDGEEESLFVTISYWESIEAMSRFTGGDPTQIHHLPRDHEFLIELPEKVEVFDITHSHGVVG